MKTEAMKMTGGSMAAVSGANVKGRGVDRYLVARGVITFLFGCAVLSWGLSDHGSLALIFFIYALLDGFLAFTFSFFTDRRGGWYLTADGVVSVLAAALTLIGPVAWSGLISRTGSMFLPYFIAGKFLVSGIFQLGSFSVFEAYERRRTVIVTGIINIVLAISLLCLRSRDPAFSLSLGACAMLIGLSFMLLQFLMPHGARTGRE